MNKEYMLFKIIELHQSIIQIIMKDKNYPKRPPSPTQMKILMYLLENKNENIYQKDMERILKVGRATVSDVLNTMEKHGLIKRISDLNNNRIKKIILTDISLEIHQKNVKKSKKIEELLLKDITKNDLKNFKRIIKQMKDNLDSVKQII